MLTEIFSIAASIIVSLGGGTLIVFAFSNWLGKVWADRLMERERQNHAVELEQLKDSLRRSSEEQLASVKAQLDVLREAQVREHTDRVAIYRGALDLIAEIVAKVQAILQRQRAPLTADELHHFEVQRLKVYAYLAMHAPQSVMDAHDALMDLILDVLSDEKEVSWEGFRELAITLLNEIRKDVGLRTEPITYKGAR